VKIRFFRPPNDRDLAALEAARERLAARWEAWEAAGLIPTVEIVSCSKNGGCILYGMSRWHDLFTSRQLLGHLTLIESLNRLKPQILAELGPERGRAVATYLQFAIDKGLDYNSKQTRWEYTRGIVKGTFSRHDLNIKWTFGEMIFTGPNSGAAWGLSPVVDAYQGIAELAIAAPRRQRWPTRNGWPKSSASVGAANCRWRANTSLPKPPTPAGESSTCSPSGHARWATRPPGARPRGCCLGCGSCSPDRSPLRSHSIGPKISAYFVAYSSGNDGHDLR
jgi:hypothetical protein